MITLEENKAKVAPAGQTVEQFHFLIDQLPQLMWICHEDGKCDFFSRQWSEFTGVPNEQLQGMGWRETLHPHDRVATCEYWYAALRGEVPYDLEYRVRRHDGQYRWFKTRANPFRDSDGKITHWFGACTEIHELMETQERLRESEASHRLLIESAKDFAIFSTDPAGIIRSWNPGAERLFGYKTEEIIGQTTRILFTPEDQAAGEPEAELERASKEGCAMDERWHRRKGDDRFFVSGTMRPLLGADGELRGFLKMARDITPREEEKELLEKTVSERTAELRETVQELETFSYSVAHDLRAPLRSMQGYASFLLEESASKLGPEELGYLRQIARSASRLDALIRDVLNYTRMARAHAPLGSIDSDQLARDVIASYPQFQPPNAEVAFQGNLPPVLGNAALFTQCISNLIGNAVKFVPKERPPKITIWAEPVKSSDGASDDHAVRICVRDNGIGIAPEHRDRVFRMFERLRPAQEFEGTGIGLTIVRKAAERMGGRVGFESIPGNGSTFWVELQKPT